VVPSTHADYTRVTPAVCRDLLHSRVDRRWKLGTTGTAGPLPGQKHNATCTGGRLFLWALCIYHDLHFLFCFEEQKGSLCTQKVTCVDRTPELYIANSSTRRQFSPLTQQSIFEFNSDAALLTKRALEAKGSRKQTQSKHHPRERLSH
jgi:hypothetical protein